MNTLELAIKTEGGVSALALAIGIAPNVISNWRNRKSVPSGWEELLKLKYTTQQPTAQVA